LAKDETQYIRDQADEQRCGAIIGAGAAQRQEQK
jgi:hypothetical protein